MRFAARASYAFLLLLALAPLAASGQSPVRYHVEVADAAQRRFRVSVTAPRTPGAPLNLAIPAWAPGYYQILNFHSGISRFRAIDAEGRDLDVTRPDRQTWRVPAGPGDVTATYEVAATEDGLGFFAAHLSEQSGFINGPAAFMYVVDGKHLPAEVTVNPPAGWNVACSLDPAGQNTWRAADYDDLADCPIQMGKFERHDFTVRDVPFSAILVGESSVDRPALVKMLTRVSEAAMGVVPSVPFKRFYYIFHFGGGGFGGGLEHRSSTVLNVWGSSGKSPEPWVGLAAHEFFHAWNVKRLRPDVLGPFDYTQPVHTDNLWFAEGVTEYYAVVIERMAGFTTRKAMLEDLAGRISQLQRNNARRRVSLAEASRRSWEGGSMGFGGLSYYLKGALVGLALDIHILDATGGARGLDDVMRRLYDQYGKRDVGYPEGAIREAVIAVSGKDLGAVYDRYVNTTEEIPWSEVLALAGLAYREGSEKVGFLGLATVEGPRKTAMVADVLMGWAAEKAGFKKGDEIITLNGARVTWAQWDERLSTMKPGARLTVGVRRGGKAVDLAAVLEAQDQTFRRLQPIPGRTDERTRKIQAALLRDTAAAAAGGARSTL